MEIYIHYLVSAAYRLQSITVSFPSIPSRCGKSCALGGPLYFSDLALLYSVSLLSTLAQASHLDEFTAGQPRKIEHACREREMEEEWTRIDHLTNK